MKSIRTYYNISLTGNCNRSCPYCIVKEQLNKSQDLLDRDGLFRYLGFAKKGDLVEITGGEPTLVPWLETLVEWLDSKEIYIVLRTNGYKLFKNKYKWLITVLNTHDEPEEYVNSREALLKPTDVIIGKTVPYEHISDTNKDAGGQPPPATWDVESSHPFINGRHIDFKGNVVAMMCHLGDAQYRIYSKDAIFDIEKTYELCGGCRHPIAAWTWVKKLGLEGEVEETLKIPTHIERVYDRLQDNQSRALFETYYRFYTKDRKTVPQQWETFVKGLMQSSSYTMRAIQGKDLYVYVPNSFNSVLLAVRLFHPNSIKGIIVDYSDPRLGSMFNEVPNVSIPIVDIDYYFKHRIPASRVVFYDAEVSECTYDLLRLGVNPKHILGINGKEMYFDTLPLEENEVFVDCGVASGDTIDNFFRYMGNKPCKVYGFDPVKSDEFIHFKNEHTTKTRGVTLVEKAVYDVTGEQVPFGNPDGYSGGDRILTHKKYQYLVETIRLDDYFKDTEITFLKMDIEGSELKALQGAREIIKRDKPKLAISIYHNANDYYEIPNFILDIVPEYVFKIRHYSIFDRETVLYGEVL